MRTFLSLLFLLSSVAAQARDPIPSLFHCQTASDCNVIESACPGWEIVNRKEAPAREAENHRIRPMIECAFLGPATKPAPECVEHVCMPTLKGAGKDRQRACAARKSVIDKVMQAAAEGCKSDSDCTAAQFGCPFACHLPMLKSSESGALRKLAERHAGECAPCDFKCPVKTSKPVCLKGRCAIF